MSEPIEINRTEEQALGQVAVSVVLGGRSFALRPLVFRDVKAWKALYAGWDEWAARIGASSASNQASADFASDRTDRMLDLLLAFDIHGVLGGRDAVEAIATPDEIEAAYAAVRQVAIPFVRNLARDPDLQFLFARIVVLEEQLTTLREALAASPSSSSGSSPATDAGPTSKPSSRRKPSS